MFASPLRLPICGLAIAALGCHAPESPEPSPPTVAVPATAEPQHVAVDVPDDWAVLGRLEFEGWLASAFAGERSARISAADLQRVVPALTSWDETAVRAALILSHADGNPGACAALIERLEQRALAPDRPSDAGDVVAAAGLATRADGVEVAPRLARLAVGPNPHPDLEVRVECAATALSFGHDEVIPFLLRVLRELTPAVRHDPPDWESKTTMAWSKSRAAHALSLAADLPLTFRPDAAVDDQLREAQRLEDALMAPR